MTKKADAVIIGGGIHGCSIAYHLAKYGCSRTVLVEKNFLASGGTGRSAAGFRHQFGTEVNIRLAAASIRMLEGLAEELAYPYDIELLQGGYLMLAYSESQLEQLTKNARLQQDLVGAGTQILMPEEISEIVPDLSLDGVLGGSFNKRDGHANPWHVTQAYAEAAKRLGVEIQTNTEAVEILYSQAKVTGVRTSRGEVIEAPVVVNAAGPDGASVAKMAGLDVPLYPERHQILVTEPLEMFIPCMVISFQHGTYFKQTPHGSILMGVGDPQHEVKDFNQLSTWQFLEDVARKITFHMPVLKEVRVVRQWAGLYDITPDSQAILGGTPELEGFYMDIGWSGHGFQLGPIVGKVLAEIITGREPSIDVSAMSVERFKTGRLIPEPACV
ncbi:FAD-dependent oxidoreductase [Clostridiales bacterium PH28_bin88]|nr:FAD-dependent oxidoreductase [Clostridiales bacterium PH28_bin88]